LKKALLNKNSKILDGIPLLSSSLNRLIDIDEDNGLSVHELSAIILDDYGLINKVLQTVNAFYYNRLGKEINTVTQAVVLLGFNTIKKIAMSMAVLELITDNSSEIVIREIGKAFVAAHLAKEIGSQQKGIEPEEIFISTLFRHLARIALAIGNPELLNDVKRLEASPDRAERLKAKRILRTVGYKLSEYWKLPKSLAGYIEGCNSAPGGQGSTHATLARDVSIFINMWEEGGTHPDFLETRSRLLKNNMDSESLEVKLQRAMEHTSNTLPIFKFPVDKQSISIVTGPVAGQDQDFPNRGELQQIQSHLEKEMLFTGLIQNLMATVNDMDAGLEQIYLLAIEILRRVIKIANIIFCKICPEKNIFSASFGMGDQAGLIKRELLFELEKAPKELQNGFLMEMETMLYWKDLLEQHGHIPEKLLSRPILIAPLAVDRKNIGCLILDKHTGNKFEPDEIQKTSIVRQLVVTATTLRARRA